MLRYLLRGDSNGQKSENERFDRRAEIEQLRTNGNGKTIPLATGDMN
jgi:hypothetical protein